MASPRSLVLLTALGLTLAATWYAAGIDSGDGAADAADELLARPAGPGPQQGRRDDRADPDSGAAGPVREPVPGTRPATTGVAARPGQTPQPASTAPAAMPAATGQRMGAGAANLFAARSWQPPPPPPRAAAAVQDLPPPVAPPLPYRYLGRMEDGGRVTVFLGEGAQTVRVVRQGDQLSDYRIDEINAQGMRLTYLPLQQPQQLLFGSPN